MHEFSRVYTKDPLAHLPSSHLLSPLIVEELLANTFLRHPSDISVCCCGCKYLLVRDATSPRLRRTEN